MSAELGRVKFAIRCDVYGRGEPEVVLFKSGTMTAGEVMPLSEAVGRGCPPDKASQEAYCSSAEFNAPRRNLAGEKSVEG